LSLEISYNYPTKPSGQYDLAYDIFFTESDKAEANPDRKAEVMIWIDGTAKEPPSCYKGDFSDGINTYSLYSWTMSDGRLYYAFLMKDPKQSQVDLKVDARKLLDNLKLNPDWYVHGIELGNEIWSGSGQIDISSLNINLNGSNHEANRLSSKITQGDHKGRPFCNLIRNSSAEPYEYAIFILFFIVSYNENKEARA
jgi:hypothetical protein